MSLMDVHDPVDPCGLGIRHLDFLITGPSHGGIMCAPSVLHSSDAQSHLIQAPG